MYLSASIRRLPTLVGLIDRCLRSELDQCLLASLEKKGDLIDYDSLPLDNSCEVEDVSEVLFLSRRMYSEKQRARAARVRVGAAHAI